MAFIVLLGKMVAAWEDEAEFSKIVKEMALTHKVKLNVGMEEFNVCV